MKIKVKDILKLNYKVEDDWFGINGEVSEIFTKGIFSDYMSIEKIPEIEVRSYLFGEKHDDCRNRELYIIFYKNAPVLLYQDVGKGDNYENILKIADKEFDELSNILLERFIEQSGYEGVEVNSLDSDIEINTYGKELKLEDNQLICWSKRYNLINKTTKKKINDAPWDYYKASARKTHQENQEDFEVVEIA